MTRNNNDIKNKIETVKVICDRLDDTGFGTEKYIPDSKTTDVYYLSLKLFCLYIAAADGTFKQEEIDLINDIFGKKESSRTLRELSKKSGALGDEFGDQIPLLLNCLIDYDNSEADSLSDSSTAMLYQLYCLLGIIVMILDEAVITEDYYRLCRFLNTVYRKMINDLALDCETLETPLEMIHKYLDGNADWLDRTLVKAEADALKMLKKNISKDELDIQIDDLLEKDEEEKEESLEDLMKQLQSLVGLDEVKYEVTSLINLCRIKKIREKNGLTFPPLSLHLVFSGNPGTGKTTVARLLAKIYKKIGVLSQGQLVEVDRSGLVGGYVGQTAIKVNEVINSAIGGVLFIDEAYALTRSSSENDYGLEAVDTLVKAMEDNRDDLIVIVAGYTEPMERFIQSNPGLKSRFNKFITFKDYTPEELTLIFKQFCQNNGYRATLDALDYVKEYFQKRCVEKPEDFGNAREVRNLFEQAMMRQANRIVLIADLKPETLTLLKKEDVSGEGMPLGKSEQLAQIALSSMTTGERMGISRELMSCSLDELELPARAISILTDNDITTLGDIISYLEDGCMLADIDDMTDYIVKEIFQKF